MGLHAPGLDDGKCGRTREKLDQGFGRFGVFRIGADGGGKFDVLLEFIRERTEQFEALDGQQLADQRDDEIGSTVQDGGDCKVGALQQNRFALYGVGDPKAFQHLRDGRRARALGSVGHGLDVEQCALDRFGRADVRPRRSLADGDANAGAADESSVD